MGRRVARGRTIGVTNNQNSYHASFNRLELKAWRRKRYLSQGTLAAMLGVSTNTVFRWESGERDFPKTMLVLALGYLDVMYDFQPDAHYARPGLGEVAGLGQVRS